MVVGFFSICLAEIVVVKEAVVESGFCCTLFCITPFVSDVPILATILFNEAKGLFCDLVFSTACVLLI